MKLLVIILLPLLFLSGCCFSDGYGYDPPATAAFFIKCTSAKITGVHYSGASTPLEWNDSMCQFNISNLYDHTTLVITTASSVDSVTFSTTATKYTSEETECYPATVSLKRSLPKASYSTFDTINYKLQSRYSYRYSRQIDSSIFSVWQ